MQWIVTLVDLAQNPGDEHAAASAADDGDNDCDDGFLAHWESFRVENPTWLPLEAAITTCGILEVEMLLGTFVNGSGGPPAGSSASARGVATSRPTAATSSRNGLTSTWSRSPRTTSRSGSARSIRPAPRARRAVLRAILRLAYRKGVTDNDGHVVKSDCRTCGGMSPRVLDARQVRFAAQRLLRSRVEAWLLVSVCAGLRRCESVGIEWADLDLRRGIVTVKSQCNGSLDMKRSPTRRPTRADGRSHYHGSQSNGSRNCATAEPAGWSAI